MTYNQIHKTNIRRPLLFCLFLFSANLFSYAQVAVNDSCHNSKEIIIGSSSYGIGVYTTDSVSMDSATIQLGEYFHSSLVTAGNDKKSVWFKFYLPVRRGVNIELKQNSNNIGTKDCGFTTYFADSCLPTSTQAVAAKLTTLNQFGSSFHPCMDPGWYMVQVSAKSRAMGKIYLELTTSFPYQYAPVTNAEFDNRDSAYDFGDQIVGKPGSQSGTKTFELGCYTVLDSTEFMSDFGVNYKDYSQSAWLTFKANKNSDAVQIQYIVNACAATDSFGFRLFKGDCRGSGSLTLLDSNVVTPQYVSCFGSCRYVESYACNFDSGQVYSIQILTHKDLTKDFTVTLNSQKGNYPSNRSKPLLANSHDLDTVRGTKIQTVSFTCASYIKNNTCGNANSDSVSIGLYKYNMSQWVHFELDQQSKLTVIFGSFRYNYNNKNSGTLAFRLFKDSIGASCSDIDTNNIILIGSTSQAYSLDCLEPGHYAVQLLGSDTTVNNSWWNCTPHMHLGGDFRLTLTQSRLPVSNRFALTNKGDADSVNGLNPLQSYAYTYASVDTISCNDGIRPDSICDSTLKKTMYRVFRIGDADGDGIADSGLLIISSLRYTAGSTAHRLYKGNALTLRDSQNISAYPDRIKGLTPVVPCSKMVHTSSIEYCLTPGDYTLVSYFDSTHISATERPSFTLYTAKTKFNTYAKAEVLDSFTSFGSKTGLLDTFTCATNPDTIDGVTCGLRNTYHVFYIDTTSVVTVGVQYYVHRYGGKRVSLFSGDIRNGKSGLKLVRDGLNWSCVSRAQATSDCRPLAAGWYTVVVHDFGVDVSYDSTNNYYPGASRYIGSRPHQVTVTTRASNVQPPQFYRPSKAADVDSLVNGNKSLTYGPNYSTTNGMYQTLNKYVLPKEWLECDLDTPLTHFPKGQLCDTNTTDIVYYTFSLAKDAYVKIWGAYSGGSWDAKLYDFDVRLDSAGLATKQPLQNCMYDPNFVEFCNLKAGTYTIVYFCTRPVTVKASVSPVIYVDSVAVSRFDHAENSYDFGRIPGDGKYYDGMPGTTHPSDTSLPPSHDLITCRTGSQFTDPVAAYCWHQVNPFVYKGDTNVSMYPYDSLYLNGNGSPTRYNPWSSVRRTIWYSFVVAGRGDVSVKLNSLASSILPSTDKAFKWSIYESDEDGSLSIASLRSSGKIDSTLGQGLKLIAHVGSQRYYCWRTVPTEYTFSISACEKVKLRRYYVVIDVNGYYHNTLANANHNVWLDVKYDSLTIPDTKFDYYSTASNLNGLNSQNIIVNPSFEYPGYWQAKRGSWTHATSGVSPKEGTAAAYANSYYWTNTDTMEYSQTVSLSAYASDISAGNATASFKGFVQSANESPPDVGRVIVEYKNASGTVVSSYTSAWTASVGSWAQLSDSRAIPSTATSVNIRLQALMKNTSNYQFDVYFDDLSLLVTVPNKNKVNPLQNKVVFRGEATYFAGSSLDTTDMNTNNSPYTGASCNDPNVTGTVWYKIEVSQVGYLYYNYIHSAKQGTATVERSGYNGNVIRLYRSTIPGDSVNGLLYTPPVGYSYDYNTELRGYAAYVCVSPGTYYIQLNRCSYHQCHDYIYPQVIETFHTGDLCSDAVELTLDSLKSVSKKVLINCHTIGTDFGEDGSNMGCLFGPKGYKSSWFKVDYTDTSKIDLEFKMAEYTDAKSTEIRYRTYYGTCPSLTPGPCNNNALTTFTLDCLRKGTYYVQIVSPNYATGELEMTVEAKKNTDTSCVPVDIFQPNAAFYYNTSCPENRVEFVNTSSQGDSIEYLWDFGYNNQTDTSLNPIFAYPALDSTSSYTVKLVVKHRTRGSSDSIEIKVEVPYSPALSINNRDTIVCKGDSVTLTSYLSHFDGVWSTGDSTSSTTVKRTGMYYFKMADKPNLLVNPSFEQNPSSSGWTTVSGTWSYTSSYDPYNQRYCGFGTSATNGVYEIYQEVDVSADSVIIDSGIAKTSLVGYMRGYQAFDDEGQVILEYYDKNGALLGVYTSGFRRVVDFWEEVVHSRTTPKGTRKLKVRLQSRRNNTKSTTSHVFFDGFRLKMRSACSYVDSVYVQVNQLPEVDLPSDTVFCKGDSLVLRPNVTYFNPYHVQDSIRNGVVGKLKNSATYSQVDSFVRLSPASGSTTGQLEWTFPKLQLSDTFKLAVDYYNLKASGYGLYYYLFANGTPRNRTSNMGGYTIIIEPTRISIRYTWSQIFSTTIPFNDNARTWEKLEIEYSNQTFTIYLDGKVMATYTDTRTRTKGGSFFGLGADNSYSNRYYIKNVHISSRNDEYVVIPAAHQRVMTYAWSDSNTDSVRTVKSTMKLKLRVTDNYGCVSNLDSTSISAVRQYDSLFTGIEEICNEFDTLYLNPIDSVGYFYGHKAVDSSGLVLVDSAQSGLNQVFFALVDSFGCYFNDTGQFLVYDVPPVSIDSVGPLCMNAGIVKLNANDSNGYFYGGSYVDSAGNFDASKAQLGMNWVYYRTADSTCVGRDSLQVQVDSIPDASITPAGPFCENAGVQTIVPKTNAGGKFRNLAYIDSTGLFDPSISTSGNHWVFYSFTDGNGCSNTDSLQIQVDSIPDASITPSGPFCKNAGVQTILPQTNTGGKFTVTSFIDSAGNFNPDSAGIGLHKIFYTFTDGNTCSDTDSTQIQVDSIPDASITPAGPFCENGGVQTILPNTNTGGKFRNLTYIDSTGLFDPSISSTGNHWVYYTFIDGNGCSNTDSMQVQVDSIPDASIVDPGRICLNQGVQTILTAWPGGKFSGGAYVDSTGLFNPAVAGVGTHKVVYVIDNKKGCFNKDSLDVIVDSIPDASIAPAGPFCINAGIQTVLPQTNIGGKFSGGVYIDSAGNFDANLAGIGLHKIFYTFIDGNTCSDTDSTQIQVDSIPDASITPAGPFCENEGVQTILPRTNTGGKFRNLAYIDSTGQFDPSISASGTHWVYYSYTDGNGCSNSDSMQILVHPMPDATIVAAGPFCYNDANIDLVVNSSGGLFEVETYLTSAGRFSPQQSQVGQNEVIYSLTNSYGCTDSDTISILVNPIPQNTISLLPNEGCEPLELVLSTQQNGDEDSLEWLYNGLQVFNTYSITEVLNAGTYPVKLSVWNALGCSITRDSVVNVFAKPVADFDYTPTKIYISDPAIYFNDLSLGNPVTWAWNFGDGNSDGVQHPQHKYASGGPYDVTLIVETANGCKDTAQKELVVLDELLAFIPTAISPNNDGRNDVFKVEGIGIVNIQIEIFNRWGEKLYQSDDFKQWDAIYQGSTVQMGSYVYIMTITDTKGLRHHKKGEIMVVR